MRFSMKLQAEDWKITLADLRNQEETPKGSDIRSCSVKEPSQIPLQWSLWWAANSELWASEQTLCAEANGDQAHKRSS